MAVTKQALLPIENVDSFMQVKTHLAQQSPEVQQKLSYIIDLLTSTKEQIRKTILHEPFGDKDRRTVAHLDFLHNLYIRFYKKQFLTYWYETMNTKYQTKINKISQYTQLQNAADADTASDEVDPDADYKGAHTDMTRITVKSPVANTYEKKQHLETWLKRFQNIDKINIPKKVLDVVIEQARIHRIHDLSTLTPELVRGYLKIKSLSKYYDYVPAIIKQVSGKQCIAIDDEISRQIMEMFVEYADAFNHIENKTRVNITSYSYTLNKFFHILGKPEFASFFPLLKSQDKLQSQDAIFMQIIDYLVAHGSKFPWRFHPSI